jgi:hypothetical protein
MAKEKIKQINGIFASAFSHAGHISKEDAKEISGLVEHEFEEVYEKGSAIAQKVIETQGNKMDTFIEHFAKQIDDYFADYGGKLFE